MTMPKNLVLVRHPESEGNVAADLSKKGDHSAFTTEFKMRHSSLWRSTDQGVNQALIAGKWIHQNIGNAFDRYYTSEYLRALEGAAYLALPNARWYAEFYLRERDWGELDRMSQEERRQKFHNALERRKIDGFFWRPPGGETMAELCIRVDRVLDTLHRECPEGSAIIVCHGEVMWGFRMRLERISQVRYNALDISTNPFDKIHNCQILHYTRMDPTTGEVSPYLNWMRSVCPWNTDLSRNKWEKIFRPTYTNQDLLAIANIFPRLIH